MALRPNAVAKQLLQTQIRGFSSQKSDPVQSLKYSKRFADKLEDNLYGDIVPIAKNSTKGRARDQTNRRAEVARPISRNAGNRNVVSPSNASSRSLPPTSRHSSVLDSDNSFDSSDKLLLDLVSFDDTFVSDPKDISPTLSSSSALAVKSILKETVAYSDPMISISAVPGAIATDGSQPSSYYTPPSIRPKLNENDNLDDFENPISNEKSQILDAGKNNRKSDFFQQMKESLNQDTLQLDNMVQQAKQSDAHALLFPMNADFSDQFANTMSPVRSGQEKIWTREERESIRVLFSTIVSTPDSSDYLSTVTSLLDDYISTFATAPPTNVYTTLVSTVLRRGRFDLYPDLISRMTADNRFDSAAAYDAFMHFLNKHDNPAAVYDFYTLMRSRGVPPSALTLGIMAAAAYRLERYADLEAIYAEATTNPSFTDDLRQCPTVYTVMIRYYVEIVGDSRRGLKILQTLRETGTKPFMACYSPFIISSVRRGLIEPALATLQDALVDGAPPTFNVVLAVAEGLVRRGLRKDIVHAQDLLNISYEHYQNRCRSLALFRCSIGDAASIPGLAGLPSVQNHLQQLAHERPDSASHIRHITAEQFDPEHPSPSAQNQLEFAKHHARELDAILDAAGESYIEPSIAYALRIRIAFRQRNISLALSLVEDAITRSTLREITNPEGDSHTIKRVSSQTSVGITPPILIALMDGFLRAGHFTKAWKLLPFLEETIESETVKDRADIYFMLLNSLSNHYIQVWTLTDNPERKARMRQLHTYEINKAIRGKSPQEAEAWTEEYRKQKEEERLMSSRDARREKALMSILEINTGAQSTRSEVKKLLRNGKIPSDIKVAVDELVAPPEYSTEPQEQTDVLSFFSSKHQIEARMTCVMNQALGLVGKITDLGIGLSGDAYTSLLIIYLLKGDKQTVKLMISTLDQVGLRISDLSIRRLSNLVIKSHRDTNYVKEMVEEITRLLIGDFTSTNSNINLIQAAEMALKSPISSPEDAPSFDQEGRSLITSSNAPSHSITQRRHLFSTILSAIRQRDHARAKSYAAIAIASGIHLGENVYAALLFLMSGSIQMVEFTMKSMVQREPMPGSVEQFTKYLRDLQTREAQMLRDDPQYSYTHHARIRSFRRAIGPKGVFSQPEFLEQLITNTVLEESVFSSTSSLASYDEQVVLSVQTSSEASAFVAELTNSDDALPELLERSDALCTLIPTLARYFTPAPKFSFGEEVEALLKTLQMQWPGHSPITVASLYRLALRAGYIDEAAALLGSRSERYHSNNILLFELFTSNVEHIIRTGHVTLGCQLVMKYTVGGTEGIQTALQTRIFPGDTAKRVPSSIKELRAISRREAIQSNQFTSPLERSHVRRLFNILTNDGFRTMNKQELAVHGMKMLSTAYALLLVTRSRITTYDFSFYTDVMRAAVRLTQLHQSADISLSAMDKSRLDFIMIDIISMFNAQKIAAVDRMFIDKSSTRRVESNVNHMQRLAKQVNLPSFAWSTGETHVPHFEQNFFTKLAADQDLVLNVETGDIFQDVIDGKKAN